MRFYSLDGWRGLAAVFVALYHLNFLSHVYDQTFINNSYLFVDFFFVLSGFVITHAYNTRLNNLQQIKKFILLRIARLWPMHITVLLLFILLEGAKLLISQSGSWNNDTIPFTNEFSISSIFTNIFLLQAMNLHEQLTWNYPSWSISVEFYTYLIFAFVYILSFRFKILIKLLYIILILGSITLLFFKTNILDDATYQNGIFRCILGFFLGSICYFIRLRIKDLKIPFVNIVEIAIIVGIIFFIVYYGRSRVSIIAPFIFFGVIFIFSFEQGIASRILKFDLFQSLGRWSYSIYMIHAFLIVLMGRVLTILEKIINTPLKVQYVSDDGLITTPFFFKNMYFMDVMTVFYLMVLIMLSAFCYTYIEKKGGVRIKSILQVN